MSRYFLHICENEDADQLRNDRTANQRISFRYIDIEINEISSLWLSSVTAQRGLCRTWSEPPKTGFVASQLI